MTYETLKNLLNQLPPEQLQDDIAIYLEKTDEYIPISGMASAQEDNDVLDKGHFYLLIDL